MSTISTMQSGAYALPVPRPASPRRAAVHGLLMVLPLFALLSLTVAAPFAGNAAQPSAAGAPHGVAPLRAGERLPNGEGTAC